MSSVPTHAMIFAAGFGKRMLPLTETCPKPLLPVNGVSMLERAIDKVEALGVPNLIVNCHHLYEQVEAFVSDRNAHITTSHEMPEILETAGGIVNVLDQLGDAPFYAINGDIIWEDAQIPALKHLAESWDSEKMDALLLLHPVADAFGYEGEGDFEIKEGGELFRSESLPRPYVFAGIQILHPCIFEGYKAEPFSLSVIYKMLLERKRLYGVVHTGKWYHIGTPESLRAAEILLKNRPT